MPNRVVFSLALGCMALLLGCEEGNDGANRHVGEITTGGDPQRGAAALTRYGCGACHSISGISGAVGLAGPPLSGIANRIYIAGVMQNSPINMMRWIRNPKAVDEKTVMPNLDVTQKDAADITAYLYTLK